MDKPPDNQLFYTHCQLGHMSVKNMKLLNLPIKANDIAIIRQCITCLIHKHKLKATTGHKERNAEEVFQHLHMDPTGQYKQGKHTYYVVVIVDHYSRYMKTLVTKDDKSKISTLISQWFEQEHAKFGHAPHVITCDKGTEFNNIEYLMDFGGNVCHGLEARVSPHLDLAPTGNKEWNGTAERAVQTFKLLRELITSHLKPEMKTNILKNRYDMRLHSTMSHLIVVLVITYHMESIMKEKQKI